jgi:hypothetical protein
LERGAKVVKLNPLLPLFRLFEVSFISKYRLYGNRLYMDRVGETGHLEPKLPFSQQAKMSTLYNRRWNGWGQQRTRTRYDKEKSGATYDKEKSGAT